MVVVLAKGMNIAEPRLDTMMKMLSLALVDSLV
jgi:hypothetical protein